MAWTVPLSEPQPSQRYLDTRKLARATEWFDFDDPDYVPVPVVELDGELVLTDGHTRAVLALLSGAEHLVVGRDDDDLPLAVSRRCVEWCLEEAVTRVADLAGRVVEADTDEELWVQRCHRAVAGVRNDEI